MTAHAEAPTEAADVVAANVPFLDKVIGTGPGCRAAFDSQTKRHHWFGSNTELAEFTARHADQPGMYYGTSVYREPTTRAATNVRHRRAFVLDIDAGPDKVAKHGAAVYADQKEAIKAAIAAVKAAGLPPTCILASGPHGLHVYFCVDADMPPAEWLTTAQKFKALFKAVGLKADDAVTADAARVLRLPGTLHSGTTRVKIVHDAGEAYPVAEFVERVAAALLRLAPTDPEPRAVAPMLGTRTASRNALLMTPADEGMGAHALPDLESAGLFLARGGHLNNYPEWVNFGQALKSLKGTEWEPDALRVWLTVCAAAPKYEGEAAAQNKWDGLGGDVSHWKTIFKIAHTHGWRSPAIEPAQVVSDSGPQKGADPDRPVDLTLAALLLAMFLGLIGYDHARRMWMYFERGAWRYCDKEQHRARFIELARHLRQRAAAAIAKAGGDEVATGKAKRLLALADRAQSANGMRAALELAQALEGFALTRAEFDRDPDLFNVANGVIHLPTGGLRPHDHAQLLHRQCPVDYHPDAPRALWLDFLRQISCDDPGWIDYMQRCLGYTLSGHVGEEKAFFWLGNGANGKSVLANLCRFIMGTYAASAPAAFLMVSKRDAGSATPELAMLPGVRLLLVNEVEAGSRLSAQTLKVAVSTEHVSARALYGNPFSFKPTHKPIIRGNHRPIITDDDEGIWRRVDLVPFDLHLSPGERDHGLESKLMAEAPGILAWMVEGFQKWRRHGLTPCRRVREASMAYRKESDLLGQWVDDTCDRDPGRTVPQRVAYANFRQWCIDQGLRCMSKRSFTTALRERGVGERRESTGTRAEVYTGIGLKA